MVVRSEAWWRRRLLPRQVELLAACGWVATAEAAELAAAGAALRATGAALGGLVALVTQVGLRFCVLHVATTSVTHCRPALCHTYMS